jgi:hypothetical protein
LNRSGLCTAEGAENAEFFAFVSYRDTTALSYADSKRPGPKARCTWIAAPIIAPVLPSSLSFSFISASSAFSAFSAVKNAAVRKLSTEH